MQNNFFNIPNPETYQCTVWRSAATHGVMYIRAFGPGTNPSGGQNIIYIRFEGVHYFEGPMEWQGADFTTPPFDETRALWFKIEPTAKLTPELLDDEFKNTLLVVNTPEFRIRILADHAFIDTQPPSFPIEKWIVDLSPHRTDKPA